MDRAGARALAPDVRDLIATPSNETTADPTKRRAIPGPPRRDPVRRGDAGCGRVDLELVAAGWAEFTW